MNESEKPPERKGLSAVWAVREVDHLFTRLSRYTRFVVYSKWGLALLAIALMASLIAWPLLSKDQSGIRVSFTDKRVSNAPAASPVMSNPDYRGTNDKGEQFKIIGTKATQKTPTLVIMDQVAAQLLKADGGWISLSADRGEFFQDREIIELYDNVTVINDKGYNFVTSRATIDTKTMDAYGNEEVNGVGPSGNLLASGFKMTDKGSDIQFVGGAKRQFLTIDRAKQTK